MTAKPARARVVTGLGEVAPALWDALGGEEGPRQNPFLRHAFLAALEESGSVGPGTGWTPSHLLLEGSDGALLGAAPMYFKSHSQGEYVFDHGWAEAFERAGGRYYPKLQIAVPFTPVTGRRLLLAPNADAAAGEQGLVAGATAFATRLGVSSIHLTFLTEGEWRRLGAAGFLQRTDQQFHWINEGYRSFDDFLAALSSRKRKLVRRERAAVADAGIAFRWLTGSDLTESVWDTFFAFYMDTGSRKWGRPYLTREFFSRLSDAMGKAVLLVLAERNGAPIAGALNLIGTSTLFGRYWGTLEDHAFLHFETCYYQAIDYAIAHGLSRVEAGAQGPHKLARGYRPVTTYSAHWIAHQGLKDAVARYLVAERAAVAEEHEMLEEHLPFRHG
ncbi:MAG: N-acetyltransferase [Alphaproteobacteria bacterium]|nr:N-acetyltransferase [Alphaproteobacteria bacterium]